MFKSRSKKLTALLTLICALALLCIGAVFLFTNTKSNVVYAADDDGVEVETVHGTFVTRYGNDTYGSTLVNNVTSLSYSSLNTSLDWCTTTAKGLTITSPEDKYSKFTYEDFQLKVKIPSGKKYVIKYTFSLSSSKKATSGSLTSGYELFYFGDERDKSSALRFNVPNSTNKTPSSSSTYTLKYANGGSTVSLSGSVDLVITYDNIDGSNPEFTHYLGFYAFAAGGSSSKTQLTASMSYKYKVFHTPVDVPTIDAEFVSVESGTDYYYETKYTGEKQTFTYKNLDAAYVSANYNSLEVKEVDSYDWVTFSLGNDAFWNDDEGGTGTRYLEVTVIKGDPKVVVNKITSCSKLPDKVPIDTEKSTQGNISWTDDATLDNPKWEFVSTDKNYDSTPVYGTAEVDIKHVFDDEHHVEGVDATCTQGGNSEYWQCTVCEKYFGDEDGTEELTSEQFAIAALGHNMTEVAAKAATCTEDGNYKYYSCSRCDGLFWDNAGNSDCTAEEVVEKKLGHNTTDTVVAPTCTSRGYTTHTCTREGCDYSYDDTYTNMLPHAWDDGEVTTAATCTTTGVKTYTCNTCNTTKTEQISAMGHDYSDEWETDGSNHWHICANECGIKGDNAAHNFAWIVDKAASFTETGLRHEECNVCHLKRNENTEIPLVTCLHEHTTHHDKVPATCVEKGTVEYKYCSDCNKNLDMSDVELSDLEIPVDPNNHDWGEWAVTTQATCTEKGTETRTCADCSHEETRDIPIDPNAHDLEHHEAQAATCTEKGWEEYDSCTRCDYTTKTEIAAKGHDFSITVSGTQPTCQQGGTATMKCSRCEETQEQNSADPVDHVYTNYVSDGNATCTQNGTKTAACDFGCGTTDTIEDEGSATGHKPGEEATCTTPQICTVCEAELSPALGHDWATEWSIDETNHWHICSRCDELNDEAAHAYEWVITKEATVEEAGLMENLCTVCGNKDGEQEIAKLIDPNGEIDLPVDINVEFKVTQSSTGNNYSDIDNGLKQGYWAQLWYRNDDGTLGDEFVDKINCFLTLKIPTDIIEAIRGGEEINRDKIAAGLKVYYIDGDGLPVEVENFTIAMRDDDSWQIKFNYNEKFRAEVVFAADLPDQPTPEPETGIPWWVWVIVGTGIAVAIILIVVIALAAKNKKNNGGTPSDNGELLSRLDNQDQILNELLTRGDDGGFNTPVELDENGNVIFK